MRKKNVIYFLCFLQLFSLNFLFATAPKGLFAQFSGYEIFIETGAYAGDGIQMALDAGYKKIYSIELSHAHVELCRNRFKDISHIELIEGDSAIEMNKLLKKITVPSVFWLDAHYSGCGDANSGKNPIIDELNAILSTNRKDHVILIDDISIYTARSNTTFSEILATVLEINPNYKIEFMDCCRPKDVFIAIP